MKKTALHILILILISVSLQSQSYKFIALDNYYKTAVPIDSIVVRNMDTGEDELYLTDSISIAVQTSIEVNEISNTGFDVYPNPANETINLRFTSHQSAPIIISDISGKVHFKSNTIELSNGSEIAINISGLTVGIYNIRCGDLSKNFIKSGEQSNSEIKIVDYNTNSLVKENEVQSQFDYRFTIYSDGFQPKLYYSEAIEIDSTIELELIPLPSAFEYKHIRVELFFKSMKEAIKYRSHSFPSTSYDTTIKDYKYIYFDTLVIRKNNVNQVKNYTLKFDKYQEDQYDRHLVQFKLVEDALILSDFFFIYEFDKVSIVYSYFNSDNLKIGVSLQENLQINFKNNTSIIHFFETPKFNLIYSKEYSYTTNCPGHYSYFSLLDYDPSQSYIKIEFLE